MAGSSAALTRVSQPARFLAVGGGGYVANLAVFTGLFALGTPYLPASILSYGLANALMYLGNRYFTFRLGHEGFWTAYLRYMLVGGVVLGLNAGILAALVETAGLDPRLGLAISLLLITPVAFVLFKRWAFGVGPAGAERRREPEGAGRWTSDRLEPQ